MTENTVELFDMHVLHVGINAAGPKEAEEIADTFTELLGFPRREVPISYLSGELVETMKGNGRGTVGHIGIAVNDLEKAIEYYEARGVKFLDQTRKFDENGRCIFIYMEKEIGGFAIHFNQAAGRNGMGR